MIRKYLKSEHYDVNIFQSSTKIRLIDTFQIYIVWYKTNILFLPYPSVILISQTNLTL